MILRESNFLLFASKCYDNPHCLDATEFEEDLKRIQYLRKLFLRYRQYKDLKERLILNHLIIIYNMFGPEATSMLFMKLEEFHDLLKPFVEYLNFMPEVIMYEDRVINKDSIVSDTQIQETLRKI